MLTTKSSMIAIRVSQRERIQFKLLSELEQKPVAQVDKDLVNKELETRKLSSSDIRRLPKEIRALVLKQMTEEALPVYLKYKDELFVDETGDGIE
jgi:hypothetical protein